LLDPAIVAHFAVIEGVGLTEIIQQRNAAAQVCLGKSQEGAEQDIGDFLLPFILLLNKVFNFLNIAVA
jgi:hypothetical protein